MRPVLPAVQRAQRASATARPERHASPRADRAGEPVQAGHRPRSVAVGFDDEEIVEGEPALHGRVQRPRFDDRRVPGPLDRAQRIPGAVCRVREHLPPLALPVLFGAQQQVDTDCGVGVVRARRRSQGDVDDDPGVGANVTASTVSLSDRPCSVCNTITEAITHLGRHRRPTTRPEQVSEAFLREQLVAVPGQEREHPALGQQVTGHRLDIQDLALWISPSLHPPILPAPTTPTRTDTTGFQERPIG